jgi:NADH-quinone oxidoreductase subunit E
MISKENIKKVEELRKRFPNSKALTIPVLWMVQEEHGWISDQAVEEIAKLLELPVNHVYGVVSFYTMFNRKPVGKYHIQMCTNVSCQLLGAERLSEYVCRKLDVRVGETTQDKKFTVTEVECLGSCGTAPMMQVNDDYYENLTEEKIDELLRRLQ